MSTAHLTTNDTIRRDLKLSLHALRIQRVADLLRDMDATEDRLRASYAAKLALNTLEPDTYDAGIVKAAEVVHQELGGTGLWREAPLYERAFALTLAQHVVSAALGVWKEVTPPGEVAQAVADLAYHKAALVEHGRRVVLFQQGGRDGEQ